MRTNVASLSGSTEPTVLMDVNTTPLIDVMLVLLVMLIITIPIQLQSINMDINGEQSVRKPVIHTVFIDFDGRVYWDDQALPDQAAIESKMREVGSMAAADQPEVYIKPNKLVDYSVVAAVMGSAQRNSVRKMGLVGNEQFVR